MCIIEELFKLEPGKRPYIEAKRMVDIFLNKWKSGDRFTFSIPKFKDFPGLNVDVKADYFNARVVFWFKDKSQKPSKTEVYEMEISRTEEPLVILGKIRNIVNMLLEEKKTILSYGYRMTDGFTFERSFKGMDGEPGKFRICRQVSKSSNKVFLKEPAFLEYSLSGWNAMADAVLRAEKRFCEIDGNAVFEMNSVLRDALTRSNNIRGSFSTIYWARS